MDLEVTRADRRLDALGLSPGLGERARDLRLAGTEEAEDAMLRRLRSREHAANRCRLECTRPQPL